MPVNRKKSSPGVSSSTRNKSLGKRTTDIGLPSSQRKVFPQSQHEMSLLDGFYKTNPQPLLAFDADSLQVIYANPAFSSLYGFSEKQVSQLNVCDLFLPSEPPTAVHKLCKQLTGSSKTVTVTHRRYNKEFMKVQLHGGTIQTASRQYAVLYINDISSQLKLEQTNILLAQIDEAIESGKNFKNSLEKAIAKIKSYAQCELGEFWLFSEENSYGFVEAYSASAKYPALKKFVEKSLSIRFTQQKISDSPLYSPMKPVWITDLKAQQSFIRGAEAQKAGISSVIALPILNQGKLLGGLFCFSINEKSVDPVVFDVLKAAAERLGKEILHHRTYDQLESFFNISGDLVCVTDMNGLFRRVNPFFVTLLGYKESELLHHSVYDFIHEDDREATVAVTQKLTRIKQIPEFTNRFRCKNGSYRWLSWSATFSEDHQLFLAVARDITAIQTAMERLQASEERYAAFLDHSSEAIWRIEIPGGVDIHSGFDNILSFIAGNGYLAECNLQFALTYGYNKPEEMTGFHLSELMPVDDPNNLDYFIAFINAGFRISDAESIEFDKKGNRKYILNNLIGIIENNRLIRIWGTQRDITALKRAEKEIINREEQYRTLSENVPAMIYRLDKDFRFTYINNAVRQTFNVPADKFIGKTPDELGLLPDRWKSLLAKGEEVFETGLSASFTFKLPSLTIPGKEYNLLINLTPEKNAQGEVSSLIAIANEITPIVQAQEALIYKDKLLSVIATAANALLREENYRNVLPAILQSFGEATSADRVYIFENSKTVRGEIISSQTMEWCAEGCSAQIDNEEFQEMPFEFFEAQMGSIQEQVHFVRITSQIQDESLRTLLMDADVKSLLIVPIFVDNECWGFIGFDDCHFEREWTEMDITVLKTFASSLASAVERKRAEDIVLESEVRFRQMADYAPVMIWVSDEQDNTIYTNKSWQDFTGVSIDEVNNNSWPALVHPEDNKIAISDYDLRFSKREPVVLEYRLRSAAGDYRWVIDHATPRFLSDGTFMGYIGSVVDIHDRKIAEEKTSYQAHLLQEVSEGIISTDLNYNIVTWNKGAEQILGISAADAIGRPMRDVVKYNYINESREESLDHLYNYNYWAGEVYYNRADGKQIYLHSSISFITNKRGARIGLVDVLHDITDKRRSEEALKISEERYRSVVDGLGEGIVLQDQWGGILTANASAERILGVTAAQMMQSDRSEWSCIHEDGSPFPPEQFPGMITLQTGKSLQNIIMGIYKRDGSLTWVSMNTEPLYYTDERVRPDAVVVSFIDITQKKTAEIELQRNERQLREYSERINNILDSITDGFIAVDNEMKVLLWNRVFEKNTGTRTIDAMGKKVIDMFPEIKGAVYSRFEEALRESKTMVQEYYSQHRGTWYETTAFPSAEGLFLYFRDITKRKQQEFLLALEKGVLELNAKPQASLKNTVDALLEGIERIFPGIYCSVLILREDGKTMETLSAPNIAAEYSKRINGVKIGPKVGSCGTAMYLKQNVIVDDIANNELWVDFRELALRHNLKACWSYPILSSQNKILASFAIYHEQVKSPSPEELEVIERTINILRIIIENKQQEERIKISNERYLLATMATNDAIWDWDVATNNMYWGEGFHGLFGYKAGSFSNDLGMWEASIHPQDRERVVSSIQHFVESNSQKVWQDEYRFRRADGKYVLVGDRGFLIYNQQGKVSRMVGSMQDITEKREMEKKLLKQELNKQKLIAQAVVDAQEKERSLIGKELHDNINQILSTAKLYLEVARNDDKERTSLIDMSTNSISDAINEIRTISRSLVPSSIGDLGLVDSIQDLVESIKLTRKLNVEFYYHNGIDEIMTEQQKLMLFRITQEQVNNVIKHANASNLVIELITEDDSINIAITDDGQGFDFEQVKVKKKGVGLSNITSRAELFNGKVQIDTAPGKGCTLNIHVPILNL